MDPSSQIQRSFLFFPELSMNQVFEVQDSDSEEGRARQFVVSSERGEGVRRASSEACGCQRCPTCSFGEGVGRRRTPSATLEGRSLACKTECNAEVSLLKAKLALKGQNKNVWQGVARVSHSEPMSDEAPSTVGIPPMPHHTGRGAMVDGPELKNAMRWFHIGALIAKGTSKLSIVEPVEGQSRSLMAALINEVPRS